GDVRALERVLTDHPELARERLASPGPWLRDKIGGALDGFFKDPYLLWFGAEDVPVPGGLPENIAEMTRAILRPSRGAPPALAYVGEPAGLFAWVPGRARENTGSGQGVAGGPGTAQPQPATPVARIAGAGRVELTRRSG